MLNPKPLAHASDAAIKIAAEHAPYLSKLAETVEVHGVKMAILSVPGEEAQEVANELVEAGITGILNFAPVVLQAPDEVMVNNVNLAMELENLSYFIQT